MEYCPWSLESLRLVRAPEGATRNRLAAPTVVNAVYQVLHGLDYLKHFGREEARARDAMGNSDQQLNSTLTIAHCDIKSDNLMINFEGLVKICDFGLGVLLEDNKHITDNMERGSEAYMAPEVAETKEYWEACDVYSLGVSAYEMLTGRLPKGRTKFGFWKKTKEMILKVTDDNSILTNQLLVLLK
ncbi:serine/threonine protein kinase, partial [Sphaeroforma arctica JP610]